MSHGDLRILLAALAWWGATMVALMEGAGLVITIVVALGWLVFCTYLLRRHFGKGRLILYWAPTLVVMAISAILASGVTAAHDHLARQGLLTELVRGQAVVTVRGTVQSYPNPAGDRVLLTMAVDEVEGRGQVSDSHSSIMLVGNEHLLDLHLQETIDVLVRLEPADKGSRTIAWATVLRDPIVVQEADPISRWIAARADLLNQHLEGEVPQVRGLVPGLAIGDDSRIPDEHGEALAAVNLTHLTAVSGAHVSMICAIVLTLIGRRNRVLAVAGCAFVLGVLILATGAQPSVMRAGVMGAVVLVGVGLRKPSSALPALGISIVVLLAFEPTLALAFGFILSAVSTGAIILWTHKVTVILAPVLSVPLANLLAVPIVAHLACAPIILLLSDTASLWSAVANALVAPVVPAGTVFALLGLLCAPVPMLGTVLAWSAARCVSWIDIVAGELSTWPGSGLPGELVMVFYGGVLLVAWLISKNRRSVVWIAALGLGVAGTRLIPSSVPHWDIVQCDVGQGAATLFRHEGRTFLVDTGSAGEGLAGCLTEAKAEVDILILTHIHDDHVGELEMVINEGTTEVWVGPGISEKLPPMAGVTVREFKAGDTKDGVEILWPLDEQVCTTSSCENDQSMVIRVDVGRRLLVPGDLESGAQSQLAKRDVSADIVLVPHHGSPNQDPGFAEAVDAELALLSYGENTYGHPAASTIDLYARFGDILRTEDGHIYLAIER